MSIDIFKDSHIIGYDAMKADLNKYADMIINFDKYKEKGVTKPGGILIAGNPGLGKTLFADEFCKALNTYAGVKSYRLRKSGRDEDFADKIQSVFEEAMENQPSIVFLDDLDKFSNDDDELCDTAEFITCQTYIDKCKEENVYVIATANDIFCLPDSLIRSGRFDKKFFVEPPDYSDAVQIIKYYLSGKKHLSDDVSPEEIAKILQGYSCSTLETVMNEAAITSSFEDSDVISEDHIVRACLRVLFDAPEKLTQREETLRNRIAVHEAGHALLSEILQKGSVSLVSVANYGSDILGFAQQFEDFDNGIGQISEEEVVNGIIVSLGGEAATKLIYNEYDCGIIADIAQCVDKLTRMYVAHYSHNFVGNGSTWLTDMRDREITRKVKSLYKKAYRLLKKNKKKLLAITDFLMKNDYMLQKDIKPIIEMA